MIVEPTGSVSGVVGSTVGPVRVRAVDAMGNAVAGVHINWVPSAGTASPSTGTSDASGIVTTTWTLGPTVGPQSLAATTSTGSPSVSLAATATTALPPPLTVAAFPAATLRYGSTFTLDGTGFVEGSTTVTVGGVPVPMNVASATRINAGMPPGGALTCAPPSTVRVVVRRQTGASFDSVVGNAPFDPAVAVTLQPGQRVVADTTGGIQCTRLENGGDYVVSLFNFTTTVPGGVAARLHGRSMNPVLAQRAPWPLQSSQVRPSQVRPSQVRPSQVRPSQVRTPDDEHLEHLARDRARLEQLGTPVPALRASRNLRPGAVRAALAVGDVLTLNAMYFDCATPTAVRARVAALGTRAVVLEDVNAPGAGTRDPLYAALADEFDRVMYPIVTTNFGDPLALDGKFGGDGHVRILLTTYVTDSVPNTIGFMTGCNFYAKSQLPSSNEAAVFYARLPNAVETANEWRRNLRATLIHETKHLAAYAEKFARAGNAAPNLEDPWLEEATARVAEELYARTFSGATWKGNAPYASTVGCEVTVCDTRPLAMFKHFAAVADYFSRVDSLTPIGATSRFDGTYYGSGWLLVRWAADQYATDEPTFFKAITTETTVRGVENLVQRTKRNAPALLADWSLALALDDRPGFTSTQPELSIPSWNVRDVLRGLNGYNVFQFPKPFPLLERTATFGDFTVDVPLLRSFTAAYVELSGSSGARQLLSLEGANGTAAPLGVWMAIARVR